MKIETNQQQQSAKCQAISKTELQQTSYNIIESKSTEIRTHYRIPDN